MAEFTITFSVADDHMDRIRYALHKHFGPVTEEVIEQVTNPETGEVVNVANMVTRQMTPEETLAKVRLMSIDNIKAIVMAVEVEEAAAVARASVSAVIVE